MQYAADLIFVSHWSCHKDRGHAASHLSSYVCCSVTSKSRVGSLTLKPLWYGAFWNVEGRLERKKCLISSLMMEAYHRPAFTLQDQKPLFSPPLIKCAVEVDLWIEIKEMSHEKCPLIIILLFIYINHLGIICSWVTNHGLYFRITDNSDLQAPYAANLCWDSLTWVMDIWESTFALVLPFTEGYMAWLLSCASFYLEHFRGFFTLRYVIKQQFDRFRQNPPIPCFDHFLYAHL